ncbi:MAG: aspartate aminotransferase family protein [Acidimicrobiia bacterium]|nr:aspartate aminotransferase family protein [Acidimicrobiia bacterium]
MSEPTASPSTNTEPAIAGFPAVSADPAEVLGEVRRLHEEDLDWRSGRSFSLVYNPDDAALEHLLEEVGVMYLHDNGLNPFKYPSLIRMEGDVVSWAAALFGTEPNAGTCTSGGTESIFLAVHTARQHARGGGDPIGEAASARPNIVTADTAHPAFAKACHYLEIDHRRVPHGDDLRADPAAMAAAIDEHTILVVASAPCYPFGVIDPVTEVAAVAAAAEVPCHVDACLGGWLLPFWERLGEPVPPWTFDVAGVTSLSADVHKYGYAFKGVSTILYRDPSWVQYQWFVEDQWPGGLYGSTTTAGTRPAAPIAGAWTAIRALGTEGYVTKARQVRDATRAFQAAVEATGVLEVHGDPDMSVFEFGARTDDDGTPLADIGGVADVMEDRGWHLDRQPGGLHAMLFPYHLAVAEEFAADLAAAVADHTTSRGVQASYGGIVQ